MSNQNQRKDKINKAILECLDRIGQAHIYAARIFCIASRYIGRLLGRISWSGRFALMAAVAAGLLIDFSVLLEEPLLRFSGFEEEQIIALYDANAFASFYYFRFVTWFFGILLFLCVFLVYRRTKWSFYLLRLAAWGFLISWFMILPIACGVPSTLLGLNRDDFDSVLRNMLWFDYIWLWIPVFVTSVFFALPTLKSSVKEFFHVPVKSFERGEVLLNNLLCRGKNPRIYRSAYWAFTYHFVILLVIPLLLGLFRFKDAYEIPKGEGAVAQVIKTIKPPKKKPKKQYVLNPNSPISFIIPELDDKRMEELDQMTENVYSATQIGPPTKNKNARSGWPKGMENARVRFIRLEYSGSDWNKNMGKDSDYNMLLKLKEYGGFKIADNTESIKVQELSHWKKDKSPPFVYITGDRGGINLNQQEVRTLRKYLLEDGGMLFADNAGGNFNTAFRAMLKRVLPEADLVDIANDDIIYQIPFSFPNGAPPLWAHSGTRALGAKYNGRWVVFYHQGDIGDAWRTGHSGTSREIQERAYKLGANVISYAFTQYLAHVYGTQVFE